MTEPNMCEIISLFWFRSYMKENEIFNFELYHCTLTISR